MQTYRDYVAFEAHQAIDRALYWIRVLFVMFYRKVKGNV